MDEQMIQRTIIVPQGSINANGSVERKSFFNESGEPVMVVNANNESYTEPELLSGWEEITDPGIGIPTTPRYFKDATGIVWVDFYAQTDENWEPGFASPAFVLPEGYRPDVTIMRLGIWSSFAANPEVSPIMIFPNGVVVVPGTTEDPTFNKCIAGFSIRPT